MHSEIEVKSESINMLEYILKQAESYEEMVECLKLSLPEALQLLL